MKRIFYFLSIVLLSGIVLSSCSPYEEGPGFSLKTKTARITGDWQIEKIEQDGQEMELVDTGDFSISFEDMTFSLEKGGTGNLDISVMGFSISVDLTWEFGEGKETLKMVVDEEGGFDMSDMFPEESTILRLSNEECWLQDIEEVNGQEVETIVYLKKQL
jgi:hypothetical protein